MFYFWFLNSCRFTFFESSLWQFQELMLMMVIHKHRQFWRSWWCWKLNSFRLLLIQYICLFPIDFQSFKHAQTHYQYHAFFPLILHSKWYDFSFLQFFSYPWWWLMFQNFFLRFYDIFYDYYSSFFLFPTTKWWHLNCCRSMDSSNWIRRIWLRTSDVYH